MMANGHVEIHDVLSNGAGPGGASDPESPSEAGSMEGSVEFRLLMAYATRRRPVGEPEPPSKSGGETTGNGDANGSAQTEEKTTVNKKKKKKKGWKRLPSVLRCVKPQTEEADEQRRRHPAPVATNHLVHDRSLTPEAPEGRQRSLEAPEAPAADEEQDVDRLGAVASRLTALADEIPFVPPDIESDAPEGSHSREVEVMIGLLLREAGDRLNEKELRDKNIAAELFWNYGFFRSLLNAVLSRMGLRSADPDAPGPQASPKTQIAVACEITTRLSVIDTLPTSRLLDHGARYLQDFYSPWAQQQGGYEEAFKEDEDDEVH
ncbi:apoptosis facilitator Bcl-2-like protein 14 [Salarias fasciatus]|uniref:Apoptosis facilitator Bcl-2-like protein 14 n=1 Tax=Salarias fasciatus TaxID=181472 RepID=A0A672IQC0_SALFA|nr:apoptosis facilitator Bcl-2-like protein 14 [Salarias fasciatus]